jgi:hypothetical protein
LSLLSRLNNQEPTHGPPTVQDLTDGDQTLSSREETLEKLVMMRPSMDLLRISLILFKQKLLELILGLLMDLDLTVGDLKSDLTSVLLLRREISEK